MVPGESELIKKCKSGEMVLDCHIGIYAPGTTIKILPSNVKRGDLVFQTTDYHFMTPALLAEYHTTFTEGPFGFRALKAKYLEGFDGLAHETNRRVKVKDATTPKNSRFNFPEGELVFPTIAFKKREFYVAKRLVDLMENPKLKKYLPFFKAVHNDF